MRLSSSLITIIAQKIHECLSIFMARPQSLLSGLPRNITIQFSTNVIIIMAGFFKIRFVSPRSEINDKLLTSSSAQEEGQSFQRLLPQTTLHSLLLLRFLFFHHRRRLLPTSRLVTPLCLVGTIIIFIFSPLSTFPLALHLIPSSLLWRSSWNTTRFHSLASNESTQGGRPLHLPSLQLHCYYLHEGGLNCVQYWPLLHRHHPSASLSSEERAGVCPSFAVAMCCHLA